MYFGQDKYCTIPYSWPLFASPFGQALVLLAQLAGYHSRPVGPAISSGILSGTGMHSSPANSTLSTSQPPTPVSRGGRSPEALRQAGHSPCNAMPRTVPQQALPGLQEGQFLLASGQLETTQSIHDQVPLQDGRDQYVEGPSDEKRLDGFTGCEGCLLLSGCEGGGQKVPPIHLGRTAIRILMPTLWSEQCPMGVHQVVETDSGFPQATGNQTGDIFRRHDSPSSIQGRPRGSNESDKSDAQTVGVHNQLGKVTADPIPTHSVPGILDRPEEHDDSSHQREDRAISPDLQGCQTAGKTLSEGPIQTNWKNDCPDSSNHSGPTVVPEPAECKKSGPTQVRILQSDGGLDTRGPGGAGLVDHDDVFLQRTECFESGTRFDNGIGCIPIGMGSSVQRYPHRRPLIPFRVSGTYQLPRIDSGSLCMQSKHSLGTGRTPTSI